jgi:hypothetical protein
MNYAEIKDGVVVNVIVADETFAVQNNLVAIQSMVGIGYTYDLNRNVFIPPRPFDSWTLNETTFRWFAPISYPTDGKYYVWDESTTSWVGTNY